MKTLKRKTRSDKFPLTLHPTGQYCKKIKGKIYYFGADRKRALERYLDQATYLHGGRNLIQKASNGNMTLKELCDVYLQYQHSKVIANDLTARHHNDQISSLNKLMAFLGPDRKIKSISTLDLQNYKRRLQKHYGSVCRLNLHISIMKAMFHWARKNDVLENIPNIDAISRRKIIHQERFTFNSEQIAKLLSVADLKMRAMIWLGLNCGFGCTDCALLKWKDLDLENNRVKLARNKTGVARNLPLWLETVEALEKVPKTGKLVFYTSRGNPYIQMLVKTDGNGNGKYTALNAITTKFSRLIKKSGLDVPKGTGFYTLRRTAATIAARSGDPFAVQRLLGHADLQMATRYVQDVSKQTDRVIENSRKYVIQVGQIMT
ncbi:MAG: tyrosine-type recombinase/integrase [Planctomycetota bacterium]|jgi:integrase